MLLSAKPVSKESLQIHKPSITSIGQKSIATILSRASKLSKVEKKLIE